MYWQKLPASLAQISATGGKEYTVHSVQYTVQTFSWLLLSFAAESSASGPQSGKAPYHSLTLPHLFYLYISGGEGACGNKNLQNTERVRNSSELSIHLNRGGLIISYNWEHTIYIVRSWEKCFRQGKAFHSGEDSVVYNEQTQGKVQYIYFDRHSKDAVICSDRTQDCSRDYFESHGSHTSEYT